MTFFISLTLISSWLDHLERDVVGVKEGVKVEGIEVERLLPRELQEVVRGIALQHQKLPVEPILEKESGIIIGEEMGYTVDIDATLVKIRSAPEGGDIRLEKVPLYPKHRSADIINASKIIGTYSTWFHGSPARYQNIATALKSINNTMIWPGEIFSFNEITGPRTPERGYLPAPIILNGDFDVGYGGGVCQVSSTVYNAALAADLTIMERHSHTKPVHYVPEGHDATVDYGWLDLKFQNSRHGPVIVKTSFYNNCVYVELRGAE